MRLLALVRGRVPYASFFFPVAFNFAHRAFVRAESLALATALIFRLPCLTGAVCFPALTFAHRARCAAAILARVAALRVERLPFPAGPLDIPPRRLLSSASSVSICSLIEAARRSCTTDNERRLVVVTRQERIEI